MKFKIINVINVHLAEHICKGMQGSSETEDSNKMTKKLQENVVQTVSSFFMALT